MNTRLKYCSIALAVCLALCLTIPQSYAQNMVYRTVTNQDSSGAFLGISMSDVTKENLSEYKLNKVEGVIVRSVVEGSPAESAGLEEDDIVLEFDGIRVRSTTQMSRLVRETPVGRQVEITVSRAGKRENISAKLEEQQETQAQNGQNFLERFLGQGPGQGPGQGLNPRDFFPEAPPDRPGMILEEPARGGPRLGVILQPLSDQMAQYMGVVDKKGVLVSSVEKGSVSEGKLKAGDIIISADEKDVEQPEDIIELVRRKTGGSITFKVIRDKKQVSVTVKMTDEEEKQERGFRL